MQGVETRTRQVVWNRNDNRVKLICLCKKSPVTVSMPAGMPSPTAANKASNGSGVLQATEIL